MNIHSNFVGGNIIVKRIEDGAVFLENDLRDTMEDWFYWAFCVEGAEGRELSFHMQKNRLGYWGPAVSHDLKNWRWLNSSDGESFTYRFSRTESKVYFAHHLLYHPDRFFSFARERGLEIAPLCRSRKGRSVPCCLLGAGEKSVFLTARHHACESTGSYVLEGMLGELVRSPIPNARVFCVPFVDFDGVVEGDQGKSRTPHDHNRDYTAESPSLYPEVAAIRACADRYGCHFGLDLHSPWHRGGRNDTVFAVRNRADKQAAFCRFSSLLEAEITAGAMQYREKNDIPPMTEWNKPGPNFSFTMNSRPECVLALTLESTYFGTAENKVSEERLLQLGVCLAKAMKNYIKEKEE